MPIASVALSPGRNGRLCLSTLALLGPALTEENAGELLARAAFRTTAEVDHLVASLRPRQTPREGIRQLAGTAGEAAVPRGVSLPADPPHEPAPPLIPPERPASPPLAPRARTSETRALSEGQWSLRVTVDRALKEDLETLSMLLSHKFPRGDLAAVLHEAIRCGIEKHGKRKVAVRPSRQVAPRGPPKDPAAISAEVRRQVWERDGGCCAWTGSDGKRCWSRWKLEVDHVRPPSREGTSTLGNLRLACREHNLLHAEEVYGRRHMDKFRGVTSPTGGGSTRAVPVAREAHATG